MNIHEFAQLPHRFRWGGQGGDDCMTFAARWVEAQTGIDLAAQWRGTYRTSAEAAALADRLGGMEVAIGAAVAAIGGRRLARTDAGNDGDIGLVRIETADATGQPYIAVVAAVRFGPLWLSIAPSGVRGKKAIDVLAAWRLPE